MAKAKEGDTVKVHYKGTLDNGEVFDSSDGKDPLEFKLGAQQVIKGFNDAVVGMEPGKKKKIHIPKEEAYGEANPQLVQQIPKSNFGDSEIKEGMILGFKAPGLDQEIPGIVKKIEGDTVTVDFNPPMAGNDLNFELTLVEIV
ncbi:peptidylprolyl isomerase [Nanoarchaeota archaeon]